MSKFHTFKVRLGNGDSVLIRMHFFDQDDYTIAIPPEAVEYVNQIRKTFVQYADLNTAQLLIKVLGEESIQHL